MGRYVLVLAVVLSLSISNVVFAAGEHKYVGVKKCSICHMSEAKGNQYKQWLSTKHAGAYKTLATPEAEEVAGKAGVSGNPQEAPECLKCHITAFGVDERLLDTEFKKEDGVQCEACHGPGGDYKSLNVMKDKAKAIEAGLIIPREEVCLKCHNPDAPNFPGFDFDEFFKKIAHPLPE